MKTNSWWDKIPRKNGHVLWLAERNERIINLAKKRKLSYERIGEQFGISKQRVEQIVNAK